MKIKLFCLLLTFSTFTKIAYCQTKKYSFKTDTVLFLVGRSGNSDRMILFGDHFSMYRSDIIKNDSIRVNIKGLSIKSFNAGITGLSSDCLSPLIDNNQKWKQFLKMVEHCSGTMWIEDIVMVDKNGIEYKPSLQSMEIDFLKEEVPK